MNKKGQGLPMNTVVIAIIVIVVLILVVTFFFGGFSNLTERIKGVLYGGTAGMSETLALQSCERYCDNLKLRSDPQDAAVNSNYCNPMDVDLDGSGIVDDNEKQVTCIELGVKCIPEEKGELGLTKEAITC